MRSFVLFAVLAVAVHARPEPPSGYAYNAPAQAPAPVQNFNQGFSGASNSYLAPAIGNGGGSYSNGAASSGSFGNGGGASFGNGGGASFGNGGGSSFGNGGGSSFGNGGGSFASGGASSSSFGNGGNGGFSNGGNGGFGGGASFGQADAGSQGTIVQKHIYVHVPPPEEEAQNAATAQQFSQPRKHYKIIFIKAPSAPSISQQIAAVQAQNEEKTLIYVLVKKPEDLDIPAAPQPAAIPVSKPEVYFIKYKTQKEQGGAGAGAGSFGGSSAGSSAGGFSGSLGVGDGGFSSGAGNGGFSGSSAGSSAGGFSGSSGAGNGGFSSGSGNGGFSGSSGSAGGFSGGFDVPAPNPQATYGAPIKK